MLAAAAGPTQAGAQTPGPQRPSNGLFFETRPKPAEGHKLDVTLSSSEGYDNDASPERRAVVGGTNLEPTGSSTMLEGTADYEWRGRRAQIRATGGSTLRYFSSLGDLLYSSDKSTSHTAAVGYSFRSARTVVATSQTATYSSSPLYNLFPRADAIGPGEAPPAAADYAINDSKVAAYSTRTTLARRLTSRNSLSETVEWQHSGMVGWAGGRLNLNVYGSRTEFSRRLARDTTTTAGYIYRTSDLDYGSFAQPGRMLTEHGVEVGFDQRRTLSATRHVTFLARFGASTIMMPASAADAAGTGDRRYDQFSGQATIDYDLGRTWQFRGTYRRGLEYLAGLSAPVSVAGFTAGIDGLLTRRVDLFASAAYSSGESALNRDSSVFDTYAGNVRLRYAMTRTWAAYAEYLYYFYDSRGSLPLVPTIPFNLDRTSVRTGLMLRVPAIRK
jgi:hypothetical protein